VGLLEEHKKVCVTEDIAMCHNIVLLIVANIKKNSKQHKAGENSDAVQYCGM